MKEPSDKPDDAPMLEDLYADSTENGSDSVMPDAADFDDFEKYINAEVLLPRDGEHMQTAKIIRRSKDQDGKLIGTHHAQPNLNTQVYDDPVHVCDVKSPSNHSITSINVKAVTRSQYSEPPSISY